MRYEEPMMEIIEMDVMNIFCTLSGEIEGDNDGNWDV